MSKIIGDLGQLIAVSFLEKSSYQVIAQNIRVGKAEADVIAVYDNTLVVIEVKSSYTKFSQVELIQKIKPAQFARLIKVGTFQLLRHPELNELRIDVIGVWLGQISPRIWHINDISLYI